jgi:sortase A
MKLRTLSVGVVVLLAMTVFATTAYRSLVSAAPEPEAKRPALAAQAPARQTAPANLPSRLEIPSVNIDAKVLQVGVGVSGNMAVPPNFIDVGWYKYGTIPGQLGSAVIDGHVDNGLALDGVFKHLGDVQINDDIYIVTNGGARRHFIVTDIQAYPYTDVPTDLIFNQADSARLNLITCEGAWVQGKKTYDHRLVVFAQLAQS